MSELAAYEAVVKERDELQAENERLRDTARNYEIAMHGARGERDSALAEVERLWVNLDESREYTKKALAERDAAIKRAEAAEQERDRLAAEKAKWQAEALRDAADEVGAMYFGPDQGVPFTRGSAHKWGSDAAATRLRNRAEHIEKGADR